MEKLDDLLLEAFHTYKVYLQSSMILEDPKAKLPLLKWPDIAQSAIGYAKAWENNPTKEETKEVANSKIILEGDLIVAVTAPIEMIYRAAHERVKQIVGKEPASIKQVDQDGKVKFPIQYKNDMIDSINDMFKKMNAITGVDYPEIRKR